MAGQLWMMALLLSSPGGDMIDAVASCWDDADKDGPCGEVLDVQVYATLECAFCVVDKIINAPALADEGEHPSAGEAGE